MNIDRFVTRLLPAALVAAAFAGLVAAQSAPKATALCGHKVFQAGRALPEHGLPGGGNSQPRKSGKAIRHRP